MQSNNQKSNQYITFMQENPIQHTIQPDKQKFIKDNVTIKRTIQLLVNQKLNGRSLTENEQWKLNHIFECVKFFSETIEKEYDQLFSQTTPVPFVKRKKKTYLHWPEYQVIEKHMNILIRQITSNSCCACTSVAVVTEPSKNLNQLKWTTAIFKLFQNYTYPLIKRYLEKTKIQREINKRTKVIQRKKDELEKKYLEEKRKLEKEEHDIRMEIDPEYREKYKKKELEIFAKNYNILQIMSGMGGLAYSN